MSVPSTPWFRVELSIFLVCSFVVRLSVSPVRALSASTVSDLGGSLSCSDLSSTAMCDSLPESDQSEVYFVKTCTHNDKNNTIG